MVRLTLRVATVCVSSSAVRVLSGNRYRWPVAVATAGTRTLSGRDRTSNLVNLMPEHSPRARSVARAERVGLGVTLTTDTQRWRRARMPHIEVAVGERRPGRLRQGQCRSDEHRLGRATA